MKPALRTVPSAAPVKRREQIGKTLLTGMPYHNEASHATSAGLLQRQIARGLKVKERT